MASDNPALTQARLQIEELSDALLVANCECSEKLVSKDQAIDALKVQVNQQAESIKQLQFDVTVSKDAAKGLRRKLKDAEKFKTSALKDMEHLRADKTRVESALASLQQDLVASKIEYEAFKSKATARYSKDTSAINKQLERSHTLLEKERADNKDLRERLESNKKLSDDFEKLQVDKNKADGRIKDMEQANAILQQQVARAFTDLTESKKECDRLQLELERQKQKSGSTSSKTLSPTSAAASSRKEKELISLKAQVKSLKAETTKLKNNKSTLPMFLRNQTLESEVQQLKTQLASKPDGDINARELTKAKADHEAALRKQTDRANALLIQNMQLYNQVTFLTSQPHAMPGTPHPDMSAVQQQLQRTETTLSQERQKHAKLRNRLEKQVSDLKATAKAEAEAAQRQLKREKETHKKLAAELHDAHQSLAKLTRENYELKQAPTFQPRETTPAAARETELAVSALISSMRQDHQTNTQQMLAEMKELKRSIEGIDGSPRKKARLDRTVGEIQVISEAANPFMFMAYVQPEHSLDKIRKKFLTKLPSKILERIGTTWVFMNQETNECIRVEDEATVALENVSTFGVTNEGDKRAKFSLVVVE